ncbi:MAG: acyltransferase domain-containing protein, partial [Acidobacteria bacterium]|nr:acyltransferase domain-containing protein [Acidobacteriota bacterium]
MGKTSSPGGTGDSRTHAVDPGRLVAVIGVGAVLPGARSAPEFWDNVVSGKNCVCEVPAGRWDVPLEGDDRPSSGLGGFVESIPFDARAFKIPPTTARLMDRAQRMALAAAVEALRDAGYDRRAFDRARAGVILGASGHPEVYRDYHVRLQLPLLEEATRARIEREGLAAKAVAAVIAELRKALLHERLPFTEDSFPGALPNVTAGRIANHLDLHGPSFSVDAACASALAALDCSVEWLLAGKVDLALTGAAFGWLDPAAFLLMSRLGVLSAGGCRPFDAAADGYVLGEGSAVFALKRLADAQRDGDRVYAVVRGIGSASAARGAARRSPDAAAQALAIARAFEQAGYDPASVQYVEAQGEATPGGDAAEVEALARVFGARAGGLPEIALGAVTSQVGHLMAAAGAAGLLRTVLALHHRRLPPTNGHERPSPRIDWGAVPFRVLSEQRPWPANRDGLPRRANVSAFGLGGVAYHAALEEYDASYHRAASAPAPAEAGPGEPVAIVGLGCVLPDSPDPAAFWNLLASKRDAVRPVPPARWENRPEAFYDPDPDAPDKTYTTLGGYVDEHEFAAEQFRLTPATARQLDRDQRLFLRAAAMAVHDAAQGGKPVAGGPRTAVVVGSSVEGQESAWRVQLRLNARAAEVELARSRELEALAFDVARRAALAADVRQALLQERLPVSEDSVLGVCAQGAAACLAGALELGGAALVTDAACASSLASVVVAVQGLRSGKWDAVVTGGMGPANAPLLYTFMSKCKAMSATGTRPFDSAADGVVFGEGAIGFVLKRLGDALRDGDRVYAVIRGAGMSSDGRGRSMTAPRPEGQALAIARAHEDAGYGPASVQFVECHATSTRVGDASEMAALREAYGPAGLPARSVRIGSVKAQIGHMSGAAGSAGLLKAVLALHHRTLPPSANVRTVNPELQLDGSPFYIDDRPADWPENADGLPRRASVSSFGFGGTNAHLTLEGFDPAYHAALAGQFALRGEPVPTASGCEVVVLGAARGEDLPGAARELAAAARADSGSLAEFARGRGRGTAQPSRLAFAAASLPEAADKLELAAKHLRPGKRSPVLEGKGIHHGAGAPELGAPAFLFPGQGSQYADMLRDLHERFEIVRQTFEEANEALRDLLRSELEDLVFTGRGRGAREVEQALMRGEVVQPAIVTADVALFRLLRRYGLRPALVAGHSLGEYAALVAAGCLDFGQALRAVYVRGREMRRLAEGGVAGRMAMISAPAAAVAPALAGIDGYVTIANLNCRVQTVISGAAAAVDEAVARLGRAGVDCRVLPIAGAFHSELAGAIREPMREALARLEVRPPEVEVISTVDGQPYPRDASCAQRVRDNLLDQLVRPVDFIGLVETAYARGARLFIEVGPKKALSTFAADVLEGRPHVALHANHPKEGGLRQLHQLLAQLAALGVPLDLDPGHPAGGKVIDVVSADGGARPGRAPGDAEAIVIAGAAAGLPGVGAAVFSDDGLDRLFAGENRIDPLPGEEQDRIVARHIVRLVKGPGGEARFEPVAGRAGSLKLAGRRGHFDLRADYGIEDDWVDSADITYRLAVAAGIEALRDAGIPLQRAYRTSSTGKRIPCGWSLPEPLRDETAVIFASAYPGLDRVIDQVSEFERRRGQGFQFDSGFVKNFLCMGNNLFAQFIRARGPNFHVNTACSSATAAVALAEDLIRCGRARRVIVLSADDCTSEHLLPWIGAGFLAAGAAATDERVADAALPFDRRRHGLVLGMGAAALVLERADAARERGLRGVAELLGTHLANSAYHPTRIDVAHVSEELEKFVARMEARHGLRRSALAGALHFMSHETFTPARGGSAQCEVQALRNVFGAEWQRITVTNTKGMTGHAQGAGIEDVVAVKALQLGKLPPVVNFKEDDPELAGVNLSRGGERELDYALRFAAGFGSQMAMFLARAAGRGAERVEDRERYAAWLREVTGIADPQLDVVRRTLRVGERVAAPVAGRPPGAVAAPAAGVADVQEAVVAIVAAKTGYERELLDLDLDLEADLGIDTIKQAQVMALVREKFGLEREQGLKLADFPTLRHVIAYIARRAGAGDAPVAGPSPGAVARPAAGVAEVQEAVVAIVAAKTGYERELLDLDLDLEADLGIDTIKQAQVMALVREKFGLEREQGLKL